MFVVLSSCVIAVLFGPERGPGFIRRAAWMFSRPTSVLEWCGLLIAVAFTATSQLVMVDLLQTEGQGIGTLGRVIVGLEFIVSLSWLGYLGFLYSRPR